MNLHSLVSGNIGAVNKFITLSIQVSLGSVKDATHKLVPRYADPVEVPGQVQPVTWRDIQQLDALNLQGTRKRIYINGQIDGIVRTDNKGGDLITLPNGDVYLVATVVEGWFTAGWCAVAATLQNGS